MRALEDHRDGLRRAPGLFLEQLMQKTILRIIRRCRVPLDKQLPALGRAQHGQLADTGLRICDNSFEKGAIMPREPFDGRRIEHRRRVFN